MNVQEVIENVRRDLDTNDRDPLSMRREGRMMIVVARLVDIIEEQQKQIDALVLKTSK